MSQQNTSTIKKDVGARFCEFRKAISKTQTQLSEELGIYQSTIASFEMGKTFPNFKYLHYFHEKYGLNINWLISGNGDKFVERYRYRIETKAPYLKDSDPQYYLSSLEKYSELLCLMEIPIIEQVILAKLLELKTFLKDEVQELYQRKNTQLSEKKENGNGDERQ